MSLQNHGNGNFILRVLFSSVNVIQAFGPMKIIEFQFRRKQKRSSRDAILNPLNPELNPICYLLAFLDHLFLHVSRIRVKSLTLRLLMSYVYMERLFLMFLDHTQRRSTVGRTPLDE